MLLAFPVLILAAAVLCVPAWLVASRRNRSSVWLLFLSTPAIAIWVAMEDAGVGQPASPANLVEVFWLLAGGVVLAYLRVFAVDRITPRWRVTAYAAIALLAVAAILLRLFMPMLPE